MPYFIFNSIKPLIIASVALVLTSLIIGCAIKSDPKDAAPVLTIAERENILKAFNPWLARGSIAIDSEKEGKFNLSYAWNVNQQNFDIKLFGPLGVQVLHLIQNENGAQLKDRNGTAEGADAMQLLQSVLGAQVPIKNMRLWAVGLPGDATEIVRDDKGRLDSMLVIDADTSRWQVEFNRYRDFENIDLPRSVTIEGNGVTIDLSFRKWSRVEPVEVQTPDKGGRLSIPGVSS